MKKVLWTTALLLCVRALASAQEAPKAPTLTLEQIVLRAQRNVEQSQSSLPDFICKERITSQVIVKGKVKREVTADVVVRAIRTNGEMVEDREVMTMDGKVAENQKLDLPLTMNGGFSKAPGLVFGPKEVGCFDFKLEGKDRINNETVLLLKATTKDDVQSLAGCKSHKPRVTGTIWLEPESMQIMRVEGPRDRHTRELKSVVVNAWPEDLLLNWVVDYSKILIDEKPFWMPLRELTTIRSTRKDRSLRYSAEYSECHKFVVSSKVLSDVTETE